ncbi:sulfite exporter TauE/SafE family protein [bacterium]|nr:sulfite exporter TauE/SafE family protein [bacterium]
MSDPIFFYILIGFVAGTLGSMVGLGGGIIMVPALTILLGVDIKSAISASLISLVATSIMSVSVFAKKELVHFKLGLILVSTTIVGSFGGSYIGVYLDPNTLMILFTALMIFAAIMLIRNLKKKTEDGDYESQTDVHVGGFFGISGKYRSEKSGQVQGFTVRRVPLNIGLSTFAGAISGMLGVGGGIIQVPMMHIVGGVPIKIASATSSFMIGFTGFAGAIVYFMYDQFDVVMTSGLIIGIIGGSYSGSKIAMKVNSKFLIMVLLVVLLYTSFRMIMKVCN